MMIQGEILLDEDTFHSTTTSARLFLWIRVRRANAHQTASNRSSVCSSLFSIPVCLPSVGPFPLVLFYVPMGEIDLADRPLPSVSPQVHFVYMYLFGIHSYM